MAQELATTGPDYFEQYAAAASGRIQGELLKFNKYGEWVAGRENTKIPHGTRLIAEMMTLQAGWIKWRDGQPVEQAMGYVAEGFRPPFRKDLDAQDTDGWEKDANTGKPRDPWQFTNSLMLVNPESGEVYTFQPSSQGGRGAINDLVRAYAKHRKDAPKDYPVVALDMSSYKHKDKKIGDVRVPVLRLADWVQTETATTDGEMQRVVARDRGGYSISTTQGTSEPPWSDEIPFDDQMPDFR